MGFKYYNYLGVVPNEFSFHPEEGHGWETTGLEWFTLEQIYQMMEEDPDSFHPGVHALFKHSGNEIERLVGKGKKQATSQDDDVTTPLQVADPPDIIETFRYMRPFERDRLIEEAPLKEVSPFELKTGQSAVSQHRVQWFMDHPDEIHEPRTDIALSDTEQPYPLVLETNDGLWLYDGNHRSAAAYKLDLMIEAKVVDLRDLEDWRQADARLIEEDKQAKEVPSKVASLTFVKHYENDDRSLQADIYKEGGTFRVDTLDTNTNYIGRQPQPTQETADQFAKNFVGIKLAKVAKQYGPENELEEEYNKKYPVAGSVVDGREVIDNVDNMSSIAATFYRYLILDDIREVDFAELYENGTKIDRNPRSIALAEEIKQSGKIMPLIIGVDRTGPFVVEGSHRYDALAMLGAKSIPAIVVLDLDELDPVTKTAAAKLYHVSEAKDEQSIRQHGINPSISEERWNPSDKGFYAFTEYADALSYAMNTVAQNTSSKALIWEVRPTKKTTYDESFFVDNAPEEWIDDEGQPFHSSVFHPGSVPKQNVKLVATYDPETGDINEKIAAVAKPGPRRYKLHYQCDRKNR